MIEPLNDLPDGVIGFAAVGQIHSDDYKDVLVPGIEAAAEKGPVRLVYILGDRFEGYSTGAAWQDTKLGLHHLAKWKRVALVTDVDWIEHLAKVFGWMIPGDFKLFAFADRDAAIAWAAED
jgi:hypothetical protein